MGLVFRPDHGVVHDSRVRIDTHALEDVKWAWNVVRRYFPILYRLTEILKTTVIGNLLQRFRIEINAFGENPFRFALRHHLETLAAAHALLQIMPSLRECVFDNGQHRVVALRKKDVAGADKDLDLIRLGPRLIEALGQVVKI